MNKTKNVTILITPFPAFPHGGRSKNQPFPLGGNGKGG